MALGKVIRPSAQNGPSGLEVKVSGDSQVVFELLYLQLQEVGDVGGPGQTTNGSAVSEGLPQWPSTALT